MSNEPTPEEIHRKNTMEWANHLANLVVGGPQYFVDGRFDLSFNTGEEIIKISLSREPNNVIPFPVKKPLPKRI
jgi:hypothetical protein